MSPNNIVGNSPISHAQKFLEFDREQLLRFLTLLPKPIELRILKSKQGVVSGYYDDPALLIRDVEFMEQNSGTFGLIEGYYVTVNQLHDGVLARSANRFRGNVKENELTSDAEVLRRWWLLIDMDAVKPKNISATDVEHDEALAATRKVMAWLTERGFPQPVMADSGNGGHLLYRVDLPNDPETRRLFSEFIKGLEKRFGNQRVKVDEKVVNASRIWKLYGTLVRKGEEIGGRKHRLAHIISMPEKLELLSLEKLQAVMAELIEPKATPETDSDDVDRSRKWVEQFLNQHQVPIQKQEPYQGGEKWLLEQCPFCANSDRCAVVTVNNRGAMGFCCQHHSCREKHWRDFRAHYEAPTETSYQEVGIQDVPGDLGDGEQTEPHDQRQRAFRIKELFQLPPVSWQVERHLPHNSLCCIYGRYGTGKSFYAVDLALSAAAGRPFLGQFKLAPMPVAYIAAEGHIGIAKRFHAWLDYFEQEPPENLVVLPERHNLLNAGSLTDLKEIMSSSLGQAPKLIICDTLARMFCGGDENSTKDMNQFVENVTHLGSLCDGASIVVLHHVGKDESRGARGSVALAGACDTMIEISAEKTGNKINSLSVRCEKQKDGPEFPNYGLACQRVDLPFDDSGSLVLVPKNGWEFQAQALNDNQRTALQKLFQTFGSKEYSWSAGLKAADVPRASFCRYLAKFKEAGFVHEPSSGVLVNQDDAALALIDSCEYAV